MFMGKIIKYHRKAYTIDYQKAHTKEFDVINTYSSLRPKNYVKIKKITVRQRKINVLNDAEEIINEELLSEKRGHLKRMLRLRYRWHFKPKLHNFKLFRKFFKKTFRRYRKIQKNRLFVKKFRQNFSKLTGYSEKFLYKKWLLIRKSYNRHWITSNALKQFSQSILLSPYGLLVALKVVPSIGASKFLIKSGAVSIDGTAITIFHHVIPGSILQINPTLFPALPELFNYQRWNYFNNIKNTIPFIYADWSSMLFTILRWPEPYELVAPSFLSEKWLRYYVYLFPHKRQLFKSTRFNTHVYKKIIPKK